MKILLIGNSAREHVIMKTLNKIHLLSKDRCLNMPKSNVLTKTKDL